MSFWSAITFFLFFFLLLWRPQVNFLVMKKKKKSCLSVCTVHYTRKETLSPNMRYSHPLEYSKKYWVILCIWRQIFFFFFFFVEKDITQPTVMSLCSFNYYCLSLKLRIISHIFCLFVCLFFPSRFLSV